MKCRDKGKYILPAAEGALPGNTESASDDSTIMMDNQITTSLKFIETLLLVCVRFNITSITHIIHKHYLGSILISSFYCSVCNTKNY